MKKILFIPIDNRPITYTLTKDITNVDKNLNLVMPDRKFLGGLITRANIDEILNFIQKEENTDLIILSLDTICYGGLVSSRRGEETFDELKERLSILKDILLEKKDKDKNLKIYATSSIMRISNNNINEEEKEYWNLYGEKIFKYSYFIHKEGSYKTDIPLNILNDYLNTRKRNFEINKIYLDWLKDNILDFLVYSKDDTGEFGLNVKEADELDKLIRKDNLSAIIKTGADEIPLGLLLRGITTNASFRIKIVYSNPDSVDKISRYEDISVKNCVEAQIKLGMKDVILVEDNPDLVLYVNNFIEKQGDLVFHDIINSNDTFTIDASTPFMVADINNANGADDKLVENILNSQYGENLLSYSGYNTSANTIGSAICLGIFSYLAKQNKTFDEIAHKKTLFIRFMDDWAYQAHERLKVQSDISEFKNLDFSYYSGRINNFLNTDFKIKYSLPWERSFEIEFNLVH